MFDISGALNTELNYIDCFVEDIWNYINDNKYTTLDGKAYAEIGHFLVEIGKHLDSAIMYSEFV